MASKVGKIDRKAKAAKKAVASLVKTSVRNPKPTFQRSTTKTVQEQTTRLLINN